MRIKSRITISRETQPSGQQPRLLASSPLWRSGATGVFDIRLRMGEKCTGARVPPLFAYSPDRRNFPPPHRVQPLASRLSVNSPNALSDADCIAKVKGGDRQAYDTLVLRYQDRLYNTLIRLTGSTDDAMDVAQDAFVQAYRKIDTFQHKAAFYTWLYRIAFNLAMSHARKRRPLTVLDSTDATHSIESTDTHSPAEHLESVERVAAVKAAIDELADEHRQVVVLRELEGCDYEQIADILEIPIGTVRSRLFRARAQLKEKLASTVE